MFKTIVLACAIASPDMCWEYHDTRGPYQTQAECRTRAYEMGNMIAEVHDGAIMAQKFRCKALTGVNL
jgi:hypothetical protein